MEDASDTVNPDIPEPDADGADLDAEDVPEPGADVAELDAEDVPEPDVAEPDIADVGAPDVAPVEPGWQSHAPLPVEITENSVAAVDGAIFVVGGFVGLQIPDTAFRYDPDADAWSQIAPAPKAGYHHASLVGFDSKLYFVAGHDGFDFTPSADAWVYDPADDVWTDRAPAPVPRGAAAAVVIDGRIWVAGGVTDTGITGSLVSYDPEADAWKADYPAMDQAREHVSGCALNGRFHVFGGRTGGLTNHDSHYVYDPVADAWEEAEPLPTARSGTAAAVWDGWCHVFGGEQLSGTFPEHEAYHPEEGWVTLPPLPTPRHGLGAATVGDRIFVIGGGPEPLFTFSDANESFGN